MAEGGKGMQDEIRTLPQKLLMGRRALVTGAGRGGEAQGRCQQEGAFHGRQWLR